NSQALGSQHRDFPCLKRQNCLNDFHSRNYEASAYQADGRLCSPGLVIDKNVLRFGITEETSTCAGSSSARMIPIPRLEYKFSCIVAALLYKLSCTGKEIRIKALLHKRHHIFSPPRSGSL